MNEIDALYLKYELDSYIATLYALHINAADEELILKHWFRGCLAAFREVWFAVGKGRGSASHRLRAAD